MPDTWETYYPRPQLRRESFFSLNGQWTLNGHEITLPWPPQAPLSGYAGEVGEKLTYEKDFCLPEGFARSHDRIILHFGGVDQTAEVLLNGTAILHHEGGYLPFSADVTDLLASGKNHLTVKAEDRLSRFYPYGKQHKKPHGMWYTPVSGIWQSVWMEAVPAEHAVLGLKLEPDLTGVTLTVETGAPCFTVTVSLGEGRMTCISKEKSLRIEIAQPHLWSPEDPYLYPVMVETDTDSVSSYFALRQVTIKEICGKSRLCLNGKAIFLHSVLDQGYFQNGLFLPSAPGEYEKDVLRMKELGFNCLRKHIKLEPEAFYQACDRHGILVLQDMVNSGGYSWFFDTVIPNFVCKKRPDRFPGNQKMRAFFENHALETQRHLYNHPCVIGYTIFNEGWGQYDSDRIYRLCKAADPSRFYDSTSGWFAQKESDVQSEHLYFKNKILTPRDPGKFLLLSECGGYVRRVDGHGDTGKDYGYGTADNKEALMERIRALYEEMVLSSIPLGLCGCVFTQLSDVEGERNGLYTYDREICKVDQEWMRALAARLEQVLEDNLYAKGS